MVYLPKRKSILPALIIELKWNKLPEGAIDQIKTRNYPAILKDYGDILTAQISPEEILKGNPIIYDRFRIDSWVFEWFLSDYFDEDNWFSEDGVLVVTREGDTEDGFVESPAFTDIPNPSIDAENKLILSQWRNSAASHSWAEYKWQDNAHILYRELCESAVWESGKDVWV